MIEVKTAGSKDDRLYKWLYSTYRLGIALALCVVIFGFILHGITEAKLTDHVVPSNQFFYHVLELDPLAIITLGILILILVPFSSVISAMVNFLVGKNKLYLGISIAVLCVLFLSLFLALI